MFFAVDYSQLLELKGTARGAGEVVRKLCRFYRAMGVYDYLINADLTGLFYGLIQSAQARKAYLTETALETLEAEPVRRSSLVEPFFDAIAASQWEIARAIAELSPQHTNPEIEYEDDFLYARMLYDIVLSGSVDGEYTSKQVERFETILEGQQSPRLELCRSFVERSQDGFADAFSELLEAYSDFVDNAAEPASGEAIAQESDFEANRNFWVEGIALLAIAKMLGLDPDDEYILCPKLAPPANFRFEPRSYPMQRL